MKRLLEINDLNAVYKSGNEVVRAVNGLNVYIDEGETLGLVGETGAGKTTTALSIMGLLPPRTGRIMSGEIFFEGRDLLTLSDRQMQDIRGEDISMIFQDPMTSLNPVLTVHEQIRECLELHNTDGRSIDEMDKRVAQMLELVGIQARRGSDYPHQFSGGMKQRVVIAMALACNPKLLIADEPTTALDVTIQAQVIEMMIELKERFRMAMLLITHDLGIVAEVCDRVAIMYAGEIIETGGVEDIFDGGKHHPYTKGLFSALPSLSFKEKRLRPIDGLMPDPTDLPSGCKFHTRCPSCMEVCRTNEAPLVELGDAHFVSCHLYRVGCRG